MRRKLIKMMLDARNIAKVYGKPGTTNNKAARHYHSYYAAREELETIKTNNDYYTMRNALIK